MTVAVAALGVSRSALVAETLKSFVNLGFKDGLDQFAEFVRADLFEMELQIRCVGVSQRVAGCGKMISRLVCSS